MLISAASVEADINANRKVPANRRRINEALRSGQSGSPWYKRPFTTSCNAGHDGSASSGSSNSFSIQAENRFSVARFQVLRKGQVLPAAEPGPPGLSGRTLISRVIGPHPTPACLSVACQAPGAGALISANQK